MKSRMILLLAALSISALMTGGCANKDVVKTEEPAVATVKPEIPAQPAQQPKAEEPAAPAKSAVEAPVEIKPADTQPTKAVADVSPFETVYFDFDKADLRADTRATITKNAEIMKKTKATAKVRIEGHCDERGSAEYNLALGERRANSVQQYLITLGVQAERLSVVSYGKEKPAVQGSGEEAWAKNRRAEFVVVK